jgi:intracellular multiplication protein IcmL
MANDILNQIIQKHKFYQSNFHRLLRIMVMGGIVNFILILLLIYAFLKPDPVRFFAVNSSGQLEQLIAQNRVVFTDKMVTNWVSMNIPRIYDIDFLNYKQQMQQAKELFDQKGWRSFTDAFGQIIKQVVADKLVMTASMTGVPMIIARGKTADSQLWKIQIPILIQHQNSDKASDSNAVITVVVMQSIHAQRLYIAQLIQSDDGVKESK